MIVRKADRIAKIDEYYFSLKLMEIARMEAEGIHILNLGIGKPDTAPAASVINALNEDSLDPKAHGYQSYRGAMVFREAISSYYKRYFNVTADPSHEILPLIGSKEGIMHISMAFLNPGDEVLVPNPGYPVYSSAAELAGAKVIHYNLTEENQFQLSMEDIKCKLTDRTKIIWINSPHMPTGTKMSYETMEALVTLGQAQNILIGSDSPYNFILNDERRSILEIEGAKDCCIELNSLSKSHGMSGWRIGMAISSEEIINAVLRFKSNMDSGIFRPIQYAAIEAMNIDPRWYEMNNRTYEERRSFIWNMLDRIGFSYDKDVSGLFVWSKVSEKFKNGDEASDFFLNECRVFAPPGRVFGSNGEMYVRWSLCEPVELIEEASKSIISVMNF